MERQVPPRLTGHRFRNAGDVVTMRQSLTRPYRPHWHDFHEIALVTGGCGRHRLDGRPAELAAGDVLIVSPSSLHAVTPEPGGRLDLVDVTFDARALPPEVTSLLSALTSSRDPVLRRLPPSSAVLFHDLAEESSTVRPYGQIAARALVAHLVVTLARHHGATRTVGDAPAWLSRVLEHVEQHYARPLPPTELAAVAHLSPAYLRERFRAETGVTLTAHIRHVRLCAARALLATTDLDINQVRRASGFGDASHFARAFRETAGCSPTAFRLANR